LEASSDRPQNKYTRQEAPPVSQLPDFELVLVDSGPHRRVWRGTGSIEATIEWTLDQDGLARVFGSERVLVNGVVAWKDFALTHGMVGWIDFPALSPEGLAYLRMERVIHRGKVTALRLSSDRVPVYQEGAVHLLSAPAPGLPIPASTPAPDASELPRPADAAPDERNSDSTRLAPTMTSQVNRSLAIAGVVALLALVVLPVAVTYAQFRHSYGAPALVAAAANGDAVRVRKLLKRGAPANSYDPEGSSALWWAVSANSPESVQLLLDHGADPNFRGLWNSVVDKAIQNLDHDDTDQGKAVARALLAYKSRISDSNQIDTLGRALHKKKAGTR